MMINIPGYQMLRLLGRGGMATVYLAHDIAADRDVALKVMLPELLADGGFAKRFLTEAGIAATLSHPHIVDVYKIGHVGDCHYLAMEYLGGGAVLDERLTPRSLAFALHVTREIADALDYVHHQGFVHRDVKTGNVLLREDGSAALTDFGIVRAKQSSARVTVVDTVVGTPQYTSPEQARGDDVDGRADLYSLGIVLYELLTGRVPYNDVDSVALGLRHIDDPLPRLPEDLAMAQLLLDRLLAKLPAHRFQTGAQVAEAIAELERLLPVSGGESRSGAVESADVRSDPWLDVESRPRPQLGILDGLDDALAQQAPPRPRQRKHSRVSAVVPVLIVALLFVAAGAAWFNQDGLRALLPETQLNRLLDQGNRALAEGRVDGGDDSALESFRRARELEQDNEVARSGLAKVAEKLMQRGRVALAENDLTAARKAVATARDVRGGGADIDELERAISATVSGRDDEAQLLEAAEASLNANRIVGANGAISFYRKLESREHGAAIARAGLLKAGKHLQADADFALAKGDLSRVAALIDDLAGNLPEYPGLADLRGRLAEARQKIRDENVQLLADAQRRVREGDLVGADNSALPLYRRVIQSDPQNRAAKDGLRRVAQALLIRANTALDDRDINDVSGMLTHIVSLEPDLSGLIPAQARLRDLQESRDIDAERPTLKPVDIEEVRQLLVKGRAAARRGALMDPPRASAYDYYREALAIDPGNVAASDGLRDLPELALGRFRDRLAVGDLPAAMAELAVVRQLAPDDSRIDRSASELLQASLALAATMIGERRSADAERALEIARRITPDNPEIAELERELAMLRR